MKQILCDKLIDCLETVYRRGIIYIPCVLLCIFVMEYFSKILTGTYTPELFSRVRDGVKIAATMAALGFYAGYMTAQTKKKPRFYEYAENLFHGTVLLLVASMLQNFISTYDNGRWPTLIAGPLFLVIKGCLLVFVGYATYCLIRGITGFLRVLHGDTEDFIRAQRELVSDS